MSARNASRVLRSVIGVGIGVVTLTVLALAGPRLEAAETPAYGADLKAFLDEMDKTYPLFDVKDLRKGWPAVKASLEKRVVRCRTDEDFLGIILEALEPVPEEVLQGLNSEIRRAEEYLLGASRTK